MFSDISLSFERSSVTLSPHSRLKRETYPEPVEHCRICDWSTVCDAQWRKDDHLSLVANITRNQRQALIAYGAETVAGLAR